jgi:hypothetical protein
MDLERGGMRGWIIRFRVRNKRGYSILRKGNLMYFLNAFSSFHPSLG